MAPVKSGRHTGDPFVPSHCFVMDSLCIINYIDDENQLDFSVTTRRSERTTKGVKRLQTKPKDLITSHFKARQVSDMIADALSTDETQNNSFIISGGSRHTMDAPNISQFRFNANPERGRASCAEPEEMVQPELEYLREIVVSLNRQIDGLELTCKKQKVQIKKLTTKVDSLQKSESNTRKLLSRRSRAVQTKESNSSTPSTKPTKAKKQTKPKPISVPPKTPLRLEIGATTAVNSPGYSFPPKSSAPTEPIPVPPKTPRPPRQESRATTAVNSPGYTFPRKPPAPTKAVFGSSAAKGSKQALQHKGHNVIERYYSGGQMPFIRQNIEKVLKSNPQIDTVVLLMGGNDCEDRHHIDEIKQQYDVTVDMIKCMLGPECTIIMSSIPQRRRCSVETHLKIALLNKHNARRNNPNHGIHYVDAAPRFGNMFMDRVHMNHQGKEYWSNIIASKLNFLSNFLVLDSQSHQ